MNGPGVHKLHDAYSCQGVSKCSTDLQVLMTSQNMLHVLINAVKTAGKHKYTYYPNIKHSTTYDVTGFTWLLVIISLCKKVFVHWMTQTAHI